ncbi:hypothetical protein E2C01_000589 [Portunus trituberculatus]|uniref:Uncharacterized protein n=1 Tax=Portunus trituberculatus TaxID=210409 RepID=A0A5B7CFI3_PORTR|nr:hypothetical protein [Portunus trituberculatus]
MPTGRSVVIHPQPERLVAGGKGRSVSLSLTASASSIPSSLRPSIPPAVPSFFLPHSLAHHRLFAVNIEFIFYNLPYTCFHYDFSRWKCVINLPVLEKPPRAGPGPPLRWTQLFALPLFRTSTLGPIRTTCRFFLGRKSLERELACLKDMSYHFGVWFLPSHRPAVARPRLASARGAPGAGFGVKTKEQDLCIVNRS